MLVDDDGGMGVRLPGLPHQGAVGIAAIIRVLVMISRMTQELRNNAGSAKDAFQHQCDHGPLNAIFDLYVVVNTDRHVN